MCGRSEVMDRRGNHRGQKGSATVGPEGTEASKVGQSGVRVGWERQQAHRNRRYSGSAFLFSIRGSEHLEQGFLTAGINP